jgi:hypothetical protein
MQRSFHHVVEYTDIGETTVAEIAASLVANEKLIRVLPRIFEELAPGVTVENIRVELERVERHSLLEDFLVVIYTKYQPQIEAVTVEAVESLTGADVPAEADTLVTVVVLLIVVYFAIKIYKRLFPEKTPVHLEGDYNTYINIVSNKFDVKPEQLEQALEAIFRSGDKRTLNKAVLDFFRPAKRGRRAAVNSPGTEGISPGAVEEFPREVDLEMLDDELADPHENVEIEFHQQDRDKSKTGWAVHIPGLYEKRLRAQVFPTVETEKLWGVLRARADIIVVHKRTDDGERQPVMVHIVNVRGIGDGDQKQG